MSARIRLAVLIVGLAGAAGLCGALLLGGGAATPDIGEPVVVGDAGPSVPGNGAGTQGSQDVNRPGDSPSEDSAEPGDSGKDDRDDRGAEPVEGRSPWEAGDDGPDDDRDADDSPDPDDSGDGERSDDGPESADDGGPD